MFAQTNIKKVNEDSIVTIATSKSQVSSINNQIGNEVGISIEKCDAIRAISDKVRNLSDQLKAGSISEEELAEYGDTCVVFEEGNPPAEYVKMISDGFAEAREMVLSGEYDMVVLDEINCTMFFGLLDAEEVLELIRKKPAHTELILTGRCAPEEIIAAADLVTEMREIKHYYNDGVQARRGIED